MSGARSGRSRILTVPNLVSFLRILLVPLFWWVLLGGRPTEAALVLVVMGVTDWLDGWLARRLDQVTDLGAFLDPVGDWLMMGSAVLGGMVEMLLPVWAGAVILSRSVAVGLWSGWMTARRSALEVRMSGKAAITFLYVAIPLFYFSSDLSGAFGAVIDAIAWVAVVVGMALYWWSGVLYVRDGLAVVREAG
ncbi:MAG: CDP-alcohol phosphatidyltransferase family protein [bacterium]|nr:CDP-alcohol phosphatidyltransferase family protein [bacterium]